MTPTALLEPPPVEAVEGPSGVPTVLTVDDEPSVLNALRRVFRSQGIATLPLAVVLTVLNEFLRDFEQYRMIVFSLLLIVMMIVRPQGLLPAGLFQRRKRA